MRSKTDSCNDTTTKCFGPVMGPQLSASRVTLPLHFFFVRCARGPHGNRHVVTCALRTGRTSYCMRAACGLGRGLHCRRSFFSLTLKTTCTCPFTCPIALIEQPAGWRRHMYMSCDMYVLQMCTARLCGSHKNHSPSRPVVNWRALNLYIALLRSRPRGAAIADRRHEVGGVRQRQCGSSVTGSHILRV